ncbi:M14 family metallopeptidase [Streptomyces europaeiscabiei]|uniref:M14 family metallopeptidase n=1 Tax=Streptomyces europaeiscabiei TaxID=146819 RepID=A0ABU4NGH8_9ACTN|nr:M14 family metallopeptidase [Streptomyces europaeiscabiei]MDX2525862.1 M14 family metallopeptidase [Streptomyces europaeiscabiei]MDX2764543.1 M14 family metallopeptidase [Streptomyces europaeiscabiei]MDX2772670.1 M14 family metallopeptidase [Streptomyces europaeiscabiei]MDX3543205.1 M14 family metallopeptidase [Streptomyces europaeiscabiei]MDX3553021.1 M14 family metallopeptidase [Streptomyces europaeiscabiei]
MRLRIRGRSATPGGTGRRSGRRTAALATLLTLALAAPVAATTTDATATSAERPRASADDIRQYEVHMHSDSKSRTALQQAGVTVDDADDHSVFVSGRADQIKKLRQQGYEITALGAAPDRSGGEGDVRLFDFPSADSRYHNYAEMTNEINSVVSANSSIASQRVIGTTYQGRNIVAIKISDNVGTDEAEPEVLFTHHQHAREHLTVEMALYLLNELTSDYGTDSRVTNMVNNREIWIIPDVNPDGGEYDVATGSYRSWRKNRQPNSGSSSVGTDLNRNWNYRWGCCGGSSGSTSSDTYRGTAAESAPEVKVVANFVRSRVVGGVQQIRTGVDFHTYSELVLWPFGYTTANTTTGMTADDRNAFATVGGKMAASNGYTPEQSSDLYITDGSIDDWLWGNQKIFAYTFEMYPGSAGGGGFYPPDEVIARETARNRDAVLQLLENSDCMYRSIGKEAQYC